MLTQNNQNYSIHFKYRKEKESAPTFVFVHDLCLDATMWSELIREMDQQMNLLVFDLYAHGKTTQSLLPFSIDHFTSDLLALLDHLHLNKIHLVGCRFSSFLAFNFALKRPEKVESLTLISFPFHFQRSTFVPECESLIQLLKLDRSLFEKKYLLENIYPITLHKAKIITRALRRVSTETIVNPYQELLQWTDFDLLQELKKLKMPVLFMHGAYDPVYPSELAMILSKYVFNSHFMLIPNSSRLVPLDQPAFAASVLCQFLASSKSSVMISTDYQSHINSMYRLIERAYHPKTTRRRYLRMSIMEQGIHVYWNGLEVKGNWNQRSAKEILLFLILNRGAVKRDTIIDAFTPDMELDKARNHLRVQLNHLNKIFQSQSDKSLQEMLIISRDSIALNADIQSDIGTYLKEIDHLFWAEENSVDKCETFLQMLEDYSPTLFNSFKGEWVQRISKNLNSKFSQIMTQLLIGLKKDDNIPMMIQLLKQGKKIEPYDGFCNEWLAAIKN
ncbi:alpha/beta fold hydrolase [Sporolactobacillus shoreicorticis]|uniref:Alpha/beta fold hydrolase n=1 Tax=Sporolactobacillus shoreicorticis TaxID=1923877 RepID=A0ABW5S2Y0_9BACL|nr:alpha/beta hydrolase [Sporolactobacillus shoreicorticis]MCO7124230.1 alpha/beta fold hydrolase [Sporolactobacillus shoreicorticis]